MADRVHTSSVPVDAAKIRRMRQLAGFTVRELASRTEISRSYMSDIETGYRKPSAPVFARLCDALKVSRNDREALLRGDDLDEVGEPVAQAVA